MNVRIGFKGLVLTSMLLLSFLGICIAGIGVVAAEYPEVPMLLVTDEYDVKLTTVPYWDIQGFDLFLHYNIEAMEPIDVQIDPDGWFAGFYDDGLIIFENTINYDEGYVRVGFVGAGPHDPPTGTGRVLHVEFYVYDPELPTGIGLMNPLPRPDMTPVWGPEYFRTTVIGFPHPEREEAPWYGVPWTVPIPHVTSPPIAIVSASPMTPYPGQMVTFDGSASYSPGIIATYAWDFESDGSIDAYGATATYAYSLKGFHLATLTVTDMQGASDSASVLISVKSLQRAWAEHPVYRVSKDEDQYNTLFVRIQNEGPASAEVKVHFAMYDKRTGMQIGEPIATPPVIVTPESFFDVFYELDVGEDLGDYEVKASLYYFSGSWILAGTDKILFKVVP